VPWRSEESLVPHTLLERCGLNLRAPIVDIVNIYSDLRRREREREGMREKKSSSTLARTVEWRRASIWAADVGMVECQRGRGSRALMEKR
jgi:hypothetical protein